MPIVAGFTVTLSGRVRETTQTAGTGTYSLDGAPPGKRTFSAGIGSGNRTLYTIESGSNFEVGVGTVTAGAPSTLSRDIVLESSNGNNPVSWPPGVKDVFCDASAALLNQIVPQSGQAGAITQTFTSSGTWTKPAGLRYIEVEGVGGGGGGGGALAGVTAGGGGGGGGIFKCRIENAVLGSTVSVTVGAAGSGGAAGNNNGTAGGSTSFGSFATGTGGAGGTGMSTANPVAEGGDGGNTTYSGTLVQLIPAGTRSGQNGQDGIRVSGLLANKGLGGNSPYGAGGKVAGGNTGDNAGTAGIGWGAGGAGGRAADTSAAGGNGAAGAVIVRSFF